ncbi:50S ribosomal protein L21 [Sphingomonas sp. KRR8]|uniref:50S ribosomal protein L21 n=1 Tax=Sphingomonas sp. KRR8 TaxID=2942996 RepID=UPI00201FE799|nr:50S ribosomal protein L21 [Sphingomonas sp. KRR8]URD60693.1 50S ribosomal protein L21 [Sphingomonas sp. KRR8]
MFAIVRTGGKQYRVAPGDKIVVEKLDGNAGDSITLSDVLLAGDGSDLKSVDGLTVAAEIVAQAKGEKVVVFKKRRRHNYRRKKGHRQQHTILRITAVGDQKAEKSAPKKAAAAPTAAAPATGAGEATPAKAPRKSKAASNPAPEDAVSNEGVAPADAGTEATHEVSTQDAAPAKKSKKAPAANPTEEK